MSDSMRLLDCNATSLLLLPTSPVCGLYLSWTHEPATRSRNATSHHAPRRLALTLAPDSVLRDYFSETTWQRDF